MLVFIFSYQFCILGDELSCHYMIDMEEAVQYSQWYVDLWEEFSKGTERRTKSESMDIEDDTSSVTSSM